jgi:hypothetical protein
MVTMKKALDKNLPSTPRSGMVAGSPGAFQGGISKKLKG